MPSLFPGLCSSVTTLSLEFASGLPCHSGTVCLIRSESTRLESSEIASSPAEEFPRKGRSRIRGGVGMSWMVSWFPWLKALSCWAFFRPKPEFTLTKRDGRNDIADIKNPATALERCASLEELDSLGGTSGGC